MMMRIIDGGRRRTTRGHCRGDAPAAFSVFLLNMMMLQQRRTTTGEQELCPATTATITSTTGVLMMVVASTRIRIEGTPWGKNI